METAARQQRQPRQPVRTINVTAKVVEVEKRWFTRAAAAEYLGVSASYIKKLHQNAKLRFYKAGGLVFIAKEDLDRLIERGRVI